MGEQSILEKMKRFIAGIAFKLFLWGNEMTQEVYWDLIFEQEQSKGRLVDWEKVAEGIK